MFRTLRGIIKLGISGSGYEKLLNDMNEGSIPCFNVRVENEKLYIEIYKNHFSKVENICKKHNLGINILSRKGIIFKILKYGKRYGIIPGIILFVIISFFLSNIVLKIDINGNENVSDEQIIDFLKRNNIDYWSFIPEIDLDNIGRKLYIEFNEISWATVRNSGGILIVDVREGTDKPNMVPINQKCNVISDKNAQIVKIKVYSGTSAVTVGDGVAKGDVLISGIVTDKFGKSQAVRAEGEITARYTEEVCFYQPLESVSLNECGKIENKSLSLWDKNFYQRNNIPEDKMVKTESRISNFSVFGIKLPIGISNDTYYLYEYKKVKDTPISAEEKCIEKIKDYEEIFYSDKIIYDKEIVKENDSKGVKIRVIYTIDSKIGVKQNIIV
ncbi:MAG: sporulation protein YqfD [Oscillospiraceae bacterium]|nr:sporulation protein YqfD [Oscillospiraceae bacterium]